MLQAIRDKTSGWVATIVLGLIMVTMMFFGIENYMQRRPDDYLVRVEGPRKMFGLLAGQVKDINEREFREAFDRARNAERAAKGKDFDAAGFETPANKRKVLDDLIDQALLKLAAERAGIVAPDALVQRAILEDKAFAGSNGKFDKTQYALILQNNNLTAQKYQGTVRDELVGTLLPTEIGNSEFVGNGELESLLKLKYQTRDVRFLEVPPPPPPGAPSEEDVKAWYASHGSLYRSPESLSVEYVEIDANNMQVDTVADEDALRKKFEENKDKYGTPDQKMASHILVALPPKATPAQQAAALAKAKDIADKARQPGADFAALAKADSDDVGSKDSGGDLGPVEKGIFGDAFDAAFAKLKPGQVSDPVKLDDGYHIIWYRELVAGNAKTFEEVKPELEQQYVQGERERLYNDLTGKLMDRISDDQTSLVGAAQDLKLPVQRTGLFNRNSGEGIAALEPVRKAAFADAQKTDRLVSDPIELEPNHVVILHVLEVKPPAPLPLAAIHDRVAADLVADREAKAAKEHAEAVLARLDKGESMDAIATELGRTVTNVPNIHREAPNPQFTPLVDAAFRLPRPQKGKTPYGLATMDPTHYAIANVTAVKDADLSTLDAKTRATLLQQIAQMRGQVEGRLYVNALRKQYKISIAEDRL